MKDFMEGGGKGHPHYNPLWNRRGGIVEAKKMEMLEIWLTEAMKGVLFPKRTLTICHASYHHAPNQSLDISSRNSSMARAARSASMRNCCCSSVLDVSNLHTSESENVAPSASSRFS